MEHMDQTQQQGTARRALYDGCYDGYGNYYSDCSTGFHWWAYLIITIALVIALGVICYVAWRRYNYRRSLMAQGVVPPPYALDMAQQYPPQYGQYPQYPPQYSSQYPPQYAQQPPYVQPNVAVAR